MSRRVPLALASLVALFLLVSIPSEHPAHGQARWSWPERSENLKVLPADTGADALRAAMVGFTRSLGVRCSHCHVGEEGQPLGTYDFVSDEKTEKGTAREMMQLVRSVNEQLGATEPAGRERLEVRCYTCHRGRPLPRTLAQELVPVYEQEGAQAAIARYRELREGFLIAGAYDFRESALNEVGYAALGAGDAEGAIEILRINVELFPESGNVHDSLAEAYLAAGDRDNAILHYEKAVELDPRNRNAAQKLEELRK